MKLLLLMATLTAIESKCIDGTTEDVSTLDSDYILRSYVRMDCTIKGFTKTPECSDGKCPDIAESPLKGLSSWGGKFKPRFYSMNSKTVEQQERVINEYIMNARLPDQEIPNAQASKWVSGAGAWSSDAGVWSSDAGVWILIDESFMISVDAGDRLSTFSVQKGGNMKEAAKRSCTINEMIKDLFQKAEGPFMWNDHVGIGLTCPSIWGTEYEFGVLARFPNLSKLPTFPHILETRNLQKKDTGGLQDGTIHLFNADSNIQMFSNSLESLIQIEKGLENGQGIKDLLSLW
uniref:Creatine kinase M-type n=1 Tax=Leptobrachium leishanense TaxID=445787 RepID=A0A8C5QLH4_9ANUR